MTDERTPLARRAPRRFAALLLGTGTALALAAAVFVWRARSAPELLHLVDPTFDQLVLHTTLELEPRGLELDETARHAVRRALTVEEVAQLFPEYGPAQAGASHLVAAPPYLFRPKADVQKNVPWPEHPAGHWTWITNSEGAREDHEFPDPPLDVFVLVAGDSHTEGVCSVSESFANVLEALSSASRPDLRIEVYNTGASGYSFYNYLGVLEANLARHPDVFVSAIYGGNDFLETLALEHVYRRTAPPVHSAEYWSLIEKATELGGPYLAQWLNQILYLREHPEEREIALESGVQAARAIAELCAQDDIAWIPVFIPPATELALAEWSELVERAARELGLSADELALGARLSERWIEAVRALGIDVLDLRAHFGPGQGRLYWKEMHLSVEGQRRIAELLEPRVESVLATRRPEATDR